MIGVDKVMRALFWCIDQYGQDWVDPNAKTSSCQNVYKHGGEERMCIGALALYKLGYDKRMLKITTGTVVESYKKQLEYGYPEIEPKGLRILQMAQAMQDKEMKWGNIPRCISVILENEKEISGLN